MRGGDLYLSWPVRHSLLILAKTTKGKEPSDAIAERVLTDWLKTNHADVWEFCQRQIADEVEIVQQLTPPEQQKKAKAKPKPQAAPVSEMVGADDDIPEVWPTEKQA